MKNYTVLLLLAVLTTSLYAQEKNKDGEARKQRWEEMKAKRAAYFTERIGFTAQEAQLFWPLYNELQEKKGKLHRQMMAQFRNGKKNERGEKIIDYASANDLFIQIKVQEANLEKCYYEKFKKILSPEKLFKFYQAERDWANKLLKELEQRGNRH